MVTGIFGPIIFGRAAGRIHTYYEIDRTYKGRFGKHMVHLRKPLTEWSGNDLLEVRMKLNLNAAWCGDPLPLLAEWHFFHENALASPLIIGGKPMGPGLSMFIIKEIKEHHKHWLGGGQLIGVELDVEFEEYIPFAEGLLSALGIPAFPGSQLIGAGAI